jgi:hypothetical protein
MQLLPSILALALDVPPPLDWIAVDGCPSLDDVVAMTRGLTAADADWAGVSVAARVVAAGDGFALTLEIATDGAPTQTHRLSSPTCAPLAKATALLVAIAVDPIATAERVPPIVVVPPPPEPPAQAAVADADAPPAASPTVDRPKRSASRTRFSLGVFAGPGIAIGPGLTGVFGARAGVGWSRARLEIGGRQTLATTAVYADRPGLGAQIRGWAVHVRGCLVPRVGPIAIPLCAGALAGRTRANGQGTDADRVVHTPRVAAVASAGVRWRFAPRAVLVGTVDVEAPLVRHPYHIDEFREPVRVVYLEPAVGVVPTLGLEVELP